MAARNLQNIIQKYLNKNKRFLLDPNFKNAYYFVLEDAEKAVIEFALKQSNFSRLKAASILGISRSTLLKKIKLYKIIINKKT